MDAEIKFGHPMFGLLRQLTLISNPPLRQSPNVVFSIAYQPVTPELAQYDVVFSVQGSPQVEINFNKLALDINFKYFNGYKFTHPADAEQRVKEAVNEAMERVAAQVGNQLSPALMVKYRDELFWSGHEISIGYYGDNQVQLAAVGKYGRPLTASQVRWTNATDGAVDMTGVQSKTVTLTRLDSAGSLTVTIRRRTSVFQDIRTIVRPIVLNIIEQKLANALDTLINVRRDSADNATALGNLIGKLESDNISLEGGAPFTPLFTEPITLTDSSAFTEQTDKGNAMRELKKRQRISRVLRTRVNTAALSNLLVQQPDKLDELLDDLLDNSGTLLAQLLLNIGNEDALANARNICIRYVNTWMASRAGSNFGMSADAPITVVTIPSPNRPVFNPNKRLYISKQVDFEGKSDFEREMNSYLATQDPPLYVFINYSQDVSTEEYLQRVQGSRPAGLPETARYLSLTLLNVPGSVKLQILGSKASEVGEGGLAEQLENYIDATTSEPSNSEGQELLDYLKAKSVELFQETGGAVYGFVYCKKCTSNTTGTLQSFESAGKNVAVLKGKTSSCFGVLFNVVGGPYAFNRTNTAFNDFSEFVYLGNQQQILIALLDNEKKYFDCSESLAQQLSNWDYCETDPTADLIDELDQILRGCLVHHGLYTPSENSSLTQLVDNVSNIFSNPILDDEKFRVEIQAGNFHQIKDSPSLHAGGQAHYTITLVQNSSGQWEMALQVSPEYLKSLNLSDDEVNRLLQHIDELFRQSQVKFCEGGEVQPECVSDPLRFLQILNLNLVNLASEGTLHRAMWDGKDRKSTLVPSLYKLGPIVGGCFDGVAERVTDVPVLVLTAGQILLVEDQRNAFLSIFSQQGLDQMKEALFKELVATIQEEDKRTHTVSKASVGLALGFYFLVSQATKSVDEALNKAKDLASKIEHRPLLKQYLKKVVRDAPDEIKAKRLQDVLNELTSEQLENLISKVDAARFDDLIKDLSENIPFTKTLASKPDLVDGWQILHNAGRRVLKLDADVLAKLNKVLRNPKLENFLPINTATRNITNKTQLVEQIVKLQDEASSIVGKRMSGMTDLMENLDHFLINFSSKPGAGEFIKELSESGGKMAGGSFVLKTLKNNADNLGTVVKFESTIANAIDEIGDIVVDVITDKGVIKNVFNEFKNWGSIPVNRYQSFTKQFTGYLTNKDIGEFYFLFKKGVDGNGLSDLSELRDQVVNAFSSSLGRTELSKLDLEKIKNITDNPLLDDLEKVDGLINYFEDLNNFKTIFKVID